ncbi:hypothetical protein Dimus_024722 [Dionaea muscipula]
MTVIRLKKKDVVKSKVRGVEVEFDHEKLATILGEEEAEKEEENQTGFDWEAVIDEAPTEGESGSGEKFYDAEDENPGSQEEQEEIQATTHTVRLSDENRGTSESTPRVLQ